MASAGDSTDADLIAELFEAAKITASRQEIWPSKVLSRILTLQNISAVLGRSSDRDLQDPRWARWIFNKHLRIFAILLFLDHPERIRDFVEHGISDDYLPLPEYLLGRKRPAETVGKEASRFDFLQIKDNNLPLPEHLLGIKRPVETVAEEASRFDFLRGWSLLQKRLFDDWQWKFLVPYFLYQGNPNHYSIRDKAILPWIHVEDSKKGSFGNIQRVTIDPDSYKFALPEVIPEATVGGGVKLS